MHNNEQVGRFLGRISAEICLKMDNLGTGSKSPKLRQALGASLPDPLMPPAAGGLAPRPPFILND